MRKKRTKAVLRATNPVPGFQHVLDCFFFPAVITIQTPASITVLQSYSLKVIQQSYSNTPLAVGKEEAS